MALQKIVHLFGRTRAANHQLIAAARQHFEPLSAEVAFEVAQRFLVACGTIDAPPFRLPPRDTAQKLIDVTDAVTIQSDRFAFAAAYRCFEVVPKAGTLIARDGAREIRTPYDECVLVMPARQPTAGQTAVRLGRFAAWDDA